MAFLSQYTSDINHGISKVGANINVVDGVISIPQSVDPDSDITFNSINSSIILCDGKHAVTSVTPTAGSGISITNLDSEGPSISFKVNNTGVTDIVAGSGITVNHNSGSVTISSYGADLIHVVGVTSSYTASLDDEYIGVNSSSNVTVTLPAGISGRVYSIKDEHGQGGGKIAIVPQPGSLVDGQPNYIISVPYQCVSVVFRSGNWWVI